MSSYIYETNRKNVRNEYNGTLNWGNKISIKILEKHYSAEVLSGLVVHFKLKNKIPITGRKQILSIISIKTAKNYFISY